MALKELKLTKSIQIFLKSLELFFHTLWRTDFNSGPAWPVDVCAAKTSTNDQKIPGKGIERIIYMIT